MLASSGLAAVGPIWRVCWANFSFFYPPNALDRTDFAHFKPMLGVPWGQSWPMSGHFGGFVGPSFCCSNGPRADFAELNTRSAQHTHTNAQRTHQAQRSPMQNPMFMVARRAKHISEAAKSCSISGHGEGKNKSKWKTTRLD